MATKALYAGSFDPVTLGHLDLIERAANIFDEVVVGVVVNLQKHTFFTFEERKQMLRKVTEHLPNVSVDMCNGLLADYVNVNGFNVVLRGLRSTADFDSEQSMAQLHKHLYNENVETVFLMADANMLLSVLRWPSRFISLGGDGSVLVPPYILEEMKRRVK